MLKVVVKTGEISATVTRDVTLVYISTELNKSFFHQYENSYHE